MSLIKKLLANILPSPIKLDFENGGGPYVQEVAPYPPEVDWDDSVLIHTTPSGIEYVRTPETQFTELSGFSFEGNYAGINGLRMHYVDEGPKDGEIILLLHGQPTWAYLYRKMIPGLVEKGYRCIAPDMIGMGKSDKPIKEAYHSYDQHCEDMLAFVQQMGLKDITVFVQDWGSLIGLRLIGENPDLFARVILANGDLPIVTEETNPFYIPNPIVVNPKLKGLRQAVAKHVLKGQVNGFQAWIIYSLSHAHAFVGPLMQLMTEVELTEEEIAAYEAPFPSFIYMAGPRMLPSMVAGIRGQTLKAWEGLGNFEKPFLSIIGLKDRLLGRRSLQAKWISHVPGAKGQDHAQFHTANHFIQDDIGDIMVEQVHRFVEKNPM